MSIDASYRLDLQLQAPILTQASGTLRFGTDTAMQVYRGHPVLNGSLIRGNLRHMLHQFAEHLTPDRRTQLQGYIQRWFGPPSSGADNNDGYQTNRACLRFDLFWTLEQPRKYDPHGQRTRIKIEAATGKVEDGALQALEDWFPVGSQPRFQGCIHADFDTEREQADFERWIKKALTAIPALGSLKGIGFGRLQRGELVVQPLDAAEEHDPTTAYLKKLPEDVTRFTLSLLPDRPFCIGKPRTQDSNRIVSTPHIPGTVLKAVLAESFKRDGIALDGTFNQIQFNHAWPVPEPGTDRPAPIPLSLAFYKTERGEKETEHPIDVDVAELAEPLAGPPGCPNWQETIHQQLHEVVPAFQPDWKDKQWEHANQRYPATTPARLLMVRTEITAGDNISKESRLFSIECTDTVDSKGHKLVWNTTVDVSRIPEDQRQSAIERILRAVSKGLHNVGKTKASLQLTAVSPPPAQARTHVDQLRDQLQVGQTVILTLASEARLLPLNLEQQLPEATGSQEALKALYQQYWGDGLKLKHFYAQQTRAGGEYYFRRFQQKQGITEYYPEWLTVRGSVFVLEIRNEAAIKQLLRWQQQGLPACHPQDSVLLEPYWKNTSFLPENGFGEILLRIQERIV